MWFGRGAEKRKLATPAFLPPGQGGARFVEFFPASGKRGRNSLDVSLGYVLALDCRLSWAAAAPQGFHEAWEAGL